MNIVPIRFLAAQDSYSDLHHHTRKLLEQTNFSMTIGLPGVVRMGKGKGGYEHGKKGKRTQV